MIICYESRVHQCAMYLSYIEFIKNKVSHKEAFNGIHPAYKITIHYCSINTHKKYVSISKMITLFLTTLWTNLYKKC